MPEGAVRGLAQNNNVHFFSGHTDTNRKLFKNVTRKTCIQMYYNVVRNDLEIVPKYLKCVSNFNRIKIKVCVSIYVCLLCLFMYI